MGKTLDDMQRAEKSVLLQYKNIISVGIIQIIFGFWIMIILSYKDLKRE